MNTLNRLTHIRQNFLAGGELLRVFPSDIRYAITDHGRCFSLRPYGRDSQLPMEMRVGNDRYRAIHIGPSRTTTCIHRMVLEAFIGPRPDGMECRHLDGNKYNNRLENLAWGSHTENMQDSSRHGQRYLKGEEHGSAKLTESEARQILSLVGSGISQRNIANQFGVSESTVYHIASGNRWKHIQEEQNA